MKFRSKYEANIASNLKKLKIVFGFETEKLDYTVPEKPHTYTPDFVIVRSDKTKLYIEAKGYLDALTRKKMIFVKNSNPTLDIRFMFMQDNPIRKGSKTYYSDWALKNGFKCTIGKDLPLEWLKK